MDALWSLHPPLSLRHLPAQRTRARSEEEKERTREREGREEEGEKGAFSSQAACAPAACLAFAAHAQLMLSDQSRRKSTLAVVGIREEEDAQPVLDSELLVALAV